jgi:hypothetical protein
MITLILVDISPDRPKLRWDLQLRVSENTNHMITLILADISPDRPKLHWDLQLRVSENTSPYDNADTCLYPT